MFVTVGSQLPFDRLIRGVDQWCEQHKVLDAVAQIANPGPNGYYPSSLRWRSFLHPMEFDRYFSSADLVVAHAGMGSIMSALLLGKPIVIMPRRAALGEHRNDHQFATVRQLASRFGANVQIALDEAELPAAIDKALGATSSPAIKVQPFAEASLLEGLRQVIIGEQLDEHSVGR